MKDSWVEKVGGQGPYDCQQVVREASFVRWHLNEDLETGKETAKVTSG